MYDTESSEPAQEDSILFRMHASPGMREMVDYFGLSIAKALAALPQRMVKVEPHASRWGHSYSIADAETGKLLGYVCNPDDLNRHRYDCCGYYVLDYSYIERFEAVS